MKYQRVIYIYNILKKAGLILPVTMLLRLVKNNEFKKLYIMFRNWQKGIPPYPERIYGKIHRYNEKYEQNVYDLGIRGYWESFLKEFNTEDFKLYFTYQPINMYPEMFFHPPSEQQLYFGLFPGSPYWDDEIVSLALSIPMNLKTKQGKTKYILRKAAALNNNQNYWMLPKIGLQNAFNFAINSREGKDWRDEQHKKILATKKYNIIREHIGEEKVDLDKLVIFNLWKRKNNINII